MFDDLDSTLAALLRRELPSTLVEQVSISFVTPDGDFPPLGVTLPNINLFLYSIQENRELRSTEPLLERQADGTVIRTMPPLRADCHYLVTAWAKKGGQNPEQDEHRLLGETLRVLHRHRELPAAALQGSLKSQTQPVRAVVLQPMQQQTTGDFWQALGGRPRAAFSYTVTIGIDTHRPEEQGHAVLTAKG
jgi:hypothetical protein